MDLQFVEPSEAPVPPEEVRIRDLSVQLLPDGRRVRLGLNITPFLEPPSIEAVIRDRHGDEITSATVIGAVTPEMEITLHLRGEGDPAQYLLELELLYPPDDPVDRREVPLSEP